ncbi:acyl-coenzyme A diphosphatase FITM2 [Tiliqua scincoides]|uniref:acyl-coenzyme A diphosphatase FITM2 n=1 Tax=Tiliqua scincoides TaxID=71010 RepID=UPI003462FD98
MEHVDRSARFLRAWLVRSSVRRTMPWGILGLMLGGSLVKEWAPLPQTYLSDKRNVLNVYFVKFAWGWTLCLLLPFISVTNYCVTKNVLVVLRRLSSLLVATAIWYVCTGIFLHIEDITGSCYKSSSLDILLQGHSSKLQCQQGGGFWHGFDISGHAFLLSYCALMILEEMAVMHNANASRNPRLHKVIDGLFLALSFLTVIWLLMFLSTAIYFHDFSQKFFGTLVGLLAWYGTYRFWYLTPLSPGLPPQSTNLSSQKFNRRL